jgi:hypothetical protein
MKCCINLCRCKRVRLYYNEKHRGVLISSRETGIEVNAGETKYVLISREQNAGQNRNIKIAGKSLKIYQSSNVCERPS